MARRIQRNLGRAKRGPKNLVYIYIRCGIAHSGLSTRVPIAAVLGVVKVGVVSRCSVERGVALVTFNSTSAAKKALGMGNRPVGYVSLGGL